MKYESAVSLVEELRGISAHRPALRPAEWVRSARFAAAAGDMAGATTVARVAEGLLVAPPLVPGIVKRRLATRAVTPAALSMLSQPAIGIARGEGPEDFRLAIRVQFETP